MKGFVFVDNGIVLRDECKGPDQEAVPIHVTFVDYQLVDVFTGATSRCRGGSPVPSSPTDDRRAAACYPPPRHRRPRSRGDAHVSRARTVGGGAVTTAAD